ncbi:MAG TPA: hypothetical protein VIX91_19540 [Candidatus Acidoferrum sp.]
MRCKKWRVGSGEKEWREGMLKFGRDLQWCYGHPRCSNLYRVALAYFAMFGLRTTRIETIRRKVNERSSIGASLDDVIRFLDSEHLAHSTLMGPEVMYMNRQHYDGMLVVWAGKKGT